MIAGGRVNSGSGTCFGKLTAQYGSAELLNGTLVGEDGFDAE